MDTNSTMEFFGSLTKLEELKPLETNILHGTLVFDSISPFVGYYDNDPGDLSPIYVYIATDRTYSVFEVLRATQILRDELNGSIDVAKAFICYGDKLINAIRIRHINDYSIVKDIQQSLINSGINLLSASVSTKNVLAKITLNKNFSFKMFTEDICIDAEESNHSYFKIPKQLSFEEFTELSKKVRNNWFESKFDAAIGCYITDQSVVDFIRIYSDKQEPGYLESLKNIFLKMIKS